jgi:hypothetical protein
MTHCKRCKLAEWKSGLCYTHTKLADGFVFDGKSFVKTIHGLEGTHLLTGEDCQRNTAESARNRKSTVELGSVTLFCDAEDPAGARGDRSRSQPELVHVHGGGATYA